MITDPARVTFTGCLGLVSMLALGDRDKTTPEQRRVMADALCNVLHAAADAVAADIEAPLLPLLVAARERLNPLRGGGAHAEMVAAIRAFTVDAPDGGPSGPHEEHLEALGRALVQQNDYASWRHYGLMCNALADATQRLRVAADAYFGGDFTKPEAS